MRSLGESSDSSRPRRRYVFARAPHEDMKALRANLTDKDLEGALDAAPPGVIDPRSWAYWNLKLGRRPAPPMTRRGYE